MYKYLNFFDAVFYINLDHRPDRRKIFEDKASKLEIPAVRFPGITPNDNEFTHRTGYNYDERRKFKIGCTLSHQSIIRTAKENGHNNVLIFEDDCEFLDNYKDMCQLYIDELKTINWDLFYFGGCPNNYCKYITENLARMDDHGGVYQTHAYAVNNTFYDKILSAVADDAQSIDTILIHSNNKEVNYILGRELLAIQEDSYSDLLGMITKTGDDLKINWKKYVTDVKKI